MAKPLSGRVAVVAGATRGAGRGIARMLGEAGAQSTALDAVAACSQTRRVTCTRVVLKPSKKLQRWLRGMGARESRGVLTTRRRLKSPRCLSRSLASRTGWILASVITGQAASWKSFLEETPAEGKSFVDGWIWPHVVTAWHGAKLMTQHRAGLIVELVEQDNVGYHGAFYFDLMETLLKRLVLGLANDLGKSAITAVAVAPGFMRTEAILEGFGVTESDWRNALSHPQAAAMGWGGSETPCFVGRAVAALAADPDVARKNGGIYTTRMLSEEYGFQDVDGSRPDYAVLDVAIEEAKKTFLAPSIDAGRFTSVDWKLALKSR